MLRTQTLKTGNNEEAHVVPVRNLEEYLTQRRTLSIPPWQREYSWKAETDGQVDVLIKDLITFARNENSSEYLIGSVILCKDETPGQSGILLIDGQQRTLTLSLFLMCARKYLRTNNLLDGNDDEHNLLSSALLRCLNDNPNGTFKARVSMDQEKANATLSRLWDWANATTPGAAEEVFKQTEGLTPTQVNLAEVAKFIYEEFEDPDWDPALLVTWLTKILKGVKLIELEVDSRREAIAIYDRINDRGMLLSSADLIKNILFQQVADDKFVEISENWKTMVEALGSSAKKNVRVQDPKYLLRALAASHDNEKLTYDDLVDFWGDRLDGVAFKINEAKERVPLPKLDAIEFSVQLNSGARALAQYNDSMYGENPLREVFIAGELGSVQHFPVLLAGHEFTSEAAFRHLANQVNARTIIYLFAKERTQAFESLAPRWGNAIAKLGKNATIADIDKVFQDVAAPSDELMENLETHFKAWRYTNATNRKRMRAVIAMLSVDLDQKLKREVHIEDAMSTKKPRKGKGWDLDHIMPQALDASDGFQAIGNLVLLSPNDNRAAKAATPSEKNVFYNQCELALTKSVSVDRSDNLTPGASRKIDEVYRAFEVDTSRLNLSSWNVASVSERTNFYYKYFVEVLTGLMY